MRGNARITALVADQLGHIWVGSENGVYISNDEEWWQKLDRHDGVPFEIIQERHNRRGYIAAIDLETPGEVKKGANFDVSDQEPASPRRLDPYRDGNPSPPRAAR